MRRIIESVILGEGFISRSSDDFLYTRDLGLIRVVNGRIEPANPIYAEVIIRKLSSDMQDELQDPKYPCQLPRYLKDGRIDMDFLMRDFQQFWHHANSDIWLKRCDDYPEAAPHLVMMAFLQRVVNGGGQIIREMASGTSRLDLCLIYENRKYPIELKIRYGDKYLEEGVEQTARYIDLHCCREAFDRRPSVKWEDKLYFRKETVDGKTVTIVGV